MTQIALNGEVLPIKSTRIDLSLDFKASDMSGETSSTDVSEQGDKGIMLSVSGLISFGDPQSLKRLIALSRAKDDSVRKVYRIGNELAKGMTVRQVRFKGKLSAKEQDNLMAWKVNFQLQEVLSVSEVKELRNSDNPTPPKASSTPGARLAKAQPHPAVINSNSGEVKATFLNAMERIPK